MKISVERRTIRVMLLLSAVLWMVNASGCGKSGGSDDHSSGGGGAGTVTGSGRIGG